jgi:hypothetical protein
MSERFLQLNTENEKDHPGDWLAANHPNAFLLLYFIARRARRTAGGLDGLGVGTAQLGDWEKMGLSRQNYRTALKILTKYKFLEILETNRTRQKSTTGSTTEGTLVRICDRRIWDINEDSPNHRPNHCLTTDQPLPNHEQERIRKKKKEKEISSPTPSFLLPSKIKFRELVELTQEQHDSLLAKHGAEIFKLMLDKLDSFKGSTGKTYASDFHTMKEGGWVVNQVKKDLEQQKRDNEKANKPAGAGQPSLNSQPSTAKFQPGRVLRGSNEGSVDSGGRNE